MAKGIVVMDIPSTCRSCNCWMGTGESHKGNVCCLTGTDIKEYVGKMTKPGDCPIKPMPEETRLINANAVDPEKMCELCDSGYCDECYAPQMLEEMLDNIPTAYDVEAVVEQLEKELKLAEEAKEIASRENVWRFEQAKGYEVALANAIEIVKGGAE